MDTVYAFQEAVQCEIHIKFEIEKKISPLLFGNNAIAYDPFSVHPTPGRKNNGKYSNFGGGQWLPLTCKPSKQLVKFAKRIKLSMLRFPGGCGVNQYDWKKTIGKHKNRPLFRFGLDEFLHLCNAIGAEPLITLSYYTGNNQDYADIVEYLNHSDDGTSNPNGGVNWAEERTRNGHPEPYGVKYFEFGNEIYAGNPLTVGYVDPKKYALNYLTCQKMMKKIDPTVQLGVVLEGSGMGIGNWDKEIIRVVQANMDFCIVHIYPMGYRSKENISLEKLFAIAWAAPAQIKATLEQLNRYIKKYTGIEVPIAITEFNGSFVQKKPVPYRHSLGNAILIAEMLRIFITARAPILCANYWQFSNSYWGMVYNRHYMEYKGKYFLRPNFFVYDLIANHFGDRLLHTDISGPGYISNHFGTVRSTLTNNEIEQIKNSKKAKVQKLSPKKWNERFISGVKVTKTPEKIGIQFKATKDIQYSGTYIIVPTQQIHHYLFRGKIKTENINSKSGIRMIVQDSRGWNKTRWAIGTNAFFGTKGWREFNLEFTTLKGNNGTRFFIHRYPEGNPLSGKLWLKDLELQDLGSGRLFPATPFLSACASTNMEKDMLYLMIINKNQRKSLTARIAVEGFAMKSEAKVWTLNGPSVDSVNENNKMSVNVKKGFFDIEKNHSLVYHFEPHSLTFIEIKRQNILN